MTNQEPRNNKKQINKDNHVLPQPFILFYSITELKNIIMKLLVQVLTNYFENFLIYKFKNKDKNLFIYQKY